jgi:hypothetical protein
MHSSMLYKLVGSAHRFYNSKLLRAVFFVEISNRKFNNETGGYGVRVKFQIALHNKDKALLELIQSYFGVGYIGKQRENSCQYTVTSIKELPVILTHFESYPLLSQKHADFLLFKSVIEIINRKEHLTLEGLIKIVAIKASLN